MAELRGVTDLQEQSAEQTRRTFARLMQNAEALCAARLASGDEMSRKAAGDFARNAELVRAALSSETIAGRLLGALVRANRRGVDALLVDLTTGATATNSLVAQCTPRGGDGFRTQGPKARWATRSSVRVR